MPMYAMVVKSDNKSQKRDIPMKEFDLIIIGAGPAGSLTAYLLSAKGFKVGVFDRNAFPVKGKVCGEYLCPAGYDLLKDLKLEKLLDDYPKVRGMNLYSPDEQLVETQFPNNKFGHSLKREKFDNDLIELAQAKGTEFFFDTNIESIEHTKEGTFVQSGGQKWKASVLVGADGRQSLVGKWLGFQKKSNSKRVAIHAYLNVKDGVKSSKGEMHIFKDGSYCGVNPVNDKYWNFSIVYDAKKLKKFSSIQKLVEDSIYERSHLSSVFDKSNTDYNISGKISNPITELGCIKKRAVLIGDAAGFIDPLTGEGIYHALLTAKIFSENLISCRDFGKALAIYEKEIKKTYHKKEIVNHFFQWLIRKSTLCNLVAHFLKSRPVARDTFVGLIGNVYSPHQAFFIILKNVFNKKGNAAYVDHY